MFKKSILSLVFASLLFHACAPDELNVSPDPNDQIEVQDTLIGVNALLEFMEINDLNEAFMACLQLTYPAQFLLSNGDTIEVLDEFELIEAITTQEIVDFVYPVTFMNSDGELIEVLDQSMLELIFAACIPDTGWDEPISDNELIPAFLFFDLCLELLYPVDLLTADLDTLTINSEEEYIEEITYGPEAFLIFPFNVETPNGDVLDIANAIEFTEALMDCGSINPPISVDSFYIVDFFCLDIQYPLNLLDELGNEIVVEDENQYMALMMSGAFYTIQFPFTLVDPTTGEIFEINVEEDLIEALEYCGIIDVEPTDPCDTPAHVLLFFNQGNAQCNYEIIYPIVLQTGNSIFTVADQAGYFELFNNYPLDSIEIIYPAAIQMLDGTGDVISFSNDEQVCAFIEDCE